MDEAQGEPRRIGTLLNPFCMPDGSVVQIQYPNSEGSFEGAKASREHCPGNQ